MSTTTQARARIDALLDANSFVEIGALVTARATDFNLKQTDTPSDGVVTGYGVIGGRLVYVYSQDSSVLNGSVGEMHAKKIAGIYDLAMKTGAPVIGLLDSAGLRLEEATDALNGFGEIYLKQVKASGVIPQITAVFGNCGGGLAIIPAITDFTFMESSKAKLFVNAPNALDGNTTAKCDTAAADFQAKETGMVDVACDEATIYEEIRNLVDMLPANNAELAVTDCEDDLNRTTDNIDNADIATAIAMIADNGIVFETKRDYAKGMTTAFIRLNGATVGVVANSCDENVICDKCAEKAADFVNFCDAFEIPVLSITNVGGYKADILTEKKIAASVGKLVYAFANATVPKVNLITGKAYGSAYVAMNSKAIGADITIAWPNSKIGSMDAKSAALIIANNGNYTDVEKATADYEALQNNVMSAARRGYVDQIVDPASTRKYIIGAFDMLSSKAEDSPAKKHGTV